MEFTHCIFDCLVKLYYKFDKRSKQIFFFKNGSAFLNMGVQVVGIMCLKVTVQFLLSAKMPTISSCFCARVFKTCNSFASFQ